MKTVAIIPALNEAQKIAAVVLSAKKFVDIVLVVNDGSTDDTVQVAKNAGALVITHCQNCGTGAATMTGIEAARLLDATYIVLLDGDGQHNADEIPLVLEPLKKNQADIVLANRFGQKNVIPFIRRVFNAIGNMLTFVVAMRFVPDSQCGFKAFGPKVIRDIDLKMSGFEFCTEIITESVQHKWRMLHVPISVTYSKYTMAKGQSFSAGVKTALKILLHSLMR